MLRKPYTLEENQLMHRLYPAAGAAALVQFLNRPLSSIYDQAKKLGLKQGYRQLAGFLIKRCTRCKTYRHQEDFQGNSPRCYRCF